MPFYSTCSLMQWTTSKSVKWVAADLNSGNKHLGVTKYIVTKEKALPL